MKIHISGAPSFSRSTVQLEPGERIVAEAGAMQSMDADLDMKAVTNGNFFSALGKKFLGGESFFVNVFANNAGGPRTVVLAQDVPGEIVELDLSGGREICLQRGAFLAAEPGIQLSTAWAGFASMIGGEGLIKLKARGEGRIVFGAYGGLVKRQVNGEFKVDDGHLVAWDPALKLSVSMAGGIVSSIFGGEGLVTRLRGSGEVYLQTRSIRGLASWLNPKFR